MDCSRSTTAIPTWCSCMLVRSPFVGPIHGHTSRRLGQLLRGLGVPDDGGQVAFQLQLAGQQSLDGVELLRRDLLPARVGRGDHEVTFLCICGRPDLDVTRLTVEQVQHDADGLRDVLIRLSLDDQPDCPFPTSGCGFVAARLVYLVLELCCPLRRESANRHVLLPEY